ncbi:MAG: hypothetical protein QG611_819 [Bacteroidota bacterium]|nr:hypothetical protein [Bacteroidota bacterium]
MAKTAVVILNWNGIRFLKMFLDVVRRNTPDAEAELYVADNGSTDGSVEWIAENFENIRVIRLDRNFGFAGGYNLALEKIEAKYYVLLNSDIEVTSGWLHTMLNFMENNQDVASCQPKILSWLQKDHFEYAGAAGGFIDRLGYPLCRGRILTHVEKDSGQYDSQSDVFWTTGACMMVRSDAWKKCGGFDPDFFAHMEEIDLCWRFHRMGYRVCYLPGSKVYHVGGGALPYDSPFKTYLNFRNSLYLLYKNLPDTKFSRIMLIRKLLDGVAALFFLIKGQFSSTAAVCKAHMDYYKHHNKLREKRRLLKITGEYKPPEMILNKFVVFEFYLKGHKTFKSLKTNF